jgi:2-oxoglutarate/2-oxoacid ferredoxin oxidoreductase subunit beta
VFGPNDEWGIVLEKGTARIVDVSEVGIDAIHVHDAKADSAGPAFALSRLSHGPVGPTPFGVFRSIDRPVYETELQQQIHDVQEARGAGELHKLLASAGTWTVE